ncbi:SDR family oxidoreductase [Patescibacteria group bacterium]|nr:SDR family oxidoreductase [Patescibacteria group bacterium]MCL5091596.1 SDR family oxidoreductase [Patescibacteria group bacterium]
MKLKDKVIVLTGASDGIGKQIALKLAEKGVKLALIARNSSGLKTTQKAALNKGAAQVICYPCDLRKLNQINVVVEQILTDFTQVDVLLNVAGIWQKMMPLEQIEATVIDDVIQTNLTGLVHCTRLLLPYLKKQPEAAIVNVVSKSGVVAQAGQSIYTASKYGARGFTDVLKAYLKGTNVRVAGVYQSGTNTDMFAKVDEHPPVEKFTDPEDLADVIVFMLSRPPKIWIHELQVEY